MQESRRRNSRPVWHYRDLDVWQHSVELFVQVTKLVRGLPFPERLVFETQTRRAARGVASSIAEGFRRWDLGDYVHSVSYASGSLGEVETDLELIARVNDVDRQLLDERRALADRTGRELTRLATSLRRLRQQTQNEPRHRPSTN